MFEKPIAELTNEELRVEKNKQKLDGIRNYVDDTKFPFEILGYNSGYMFFLPHETGQIFKIKKGSLNNQHLLELAPLDYWRAIYGQESKKGFSISWMDAQDDIIRECNKKNPFNLTNIRGRGTWKEGNNIIIHTGKNLLLESEILDVKKYSPNGHVYERLPELKLNIVKSELLNSELEKVVSCFRNLSISNRLERNFLVGWCVLAPFCGALDWRPHIWITGPAGSGKSAIVHMIIHKMLGEFIFCPEGDSSGAGIIQGLRNDSLPVVHDEIDRTSLNMMNLETELSITRSSSSASEKTRLYKGTADQIGKEYNYNSMFCFSSINVYLNKKSDKSRFSIINLTKNLNIEWKIFRKEIQETFTKKICDKIKSKIFYNWDIVKENIIVFKNYVGQYLKDQRSGDQVGTLLAGAASLLNMKKYTETEVDNICMKNLREYYYNDESLSDEMECLLRIFTARISYIDHNEKREDTTLFNLLKLAAGNVDGRQPDVRAQKELFKYGIKYNEKKNIVYMANNYEWIKNLIKDTPWKYNYANLLRRLDFVDNEMEVQSYGSYSNYRSIAMDANYIFRLSNDSTFMEAGF